MVSWKSNGKDKENVEIKLVKKSQKEGASKNPKANNPVHEVVLLREHEEKLSSMI